MPALDINWLSLSPMITLLATASVVLLLALFHRGTRPSAVLSLVGIAVAAGLNTQLFVSSQRGNPLSSFNLRYLADNASVALTFVLLLGAALAILLSFDYIRRADLEHPEYYPLLLLSTTGAMVLVAAGDLITLLLGLEIMSLAVYVLSAWRPGARESAEAGMKYFLLGAFASAFLIYGIALMYGATGYFTYNEIAQALTAEGSTVPLLAVLGGLIILTGLAFKAALAPFHWWAPDVYTGAPTSVTAFMSVVVKAAAVAALLRIFAAVFPALPLLEASLSVIVALTLIIGNLAALRQRGVKRILAYSAVAHAGYLALAVLAAGDAGTRAAIWYLTAYTLMNIGAFAVLTLITDKNDRGDNLERLAGLGRSKPWLAAAMTLFLLSLAGIPPLAGFIGKIFVFQAAIEQGYMVLAVLGILTSAVAMVYYFRPIGYMYFREPEYNTPRYRSVATNLAIGIAAAGTLLLGLLPGWWYNLLEVGQQFFAGF